LVAANQKMPLFLPVPAFLILLQPLKTTYKSFPMKFLPM
jgi:hypothetical protein